MQKIDSREWNTRWSSTNITSSVSNSADVLKKEISRILRCTLFVILKGRKVDNPAAALRLFP